MKPPLSLGYNAEHSSQPTPPEETAAAEGISNANPTIWVGL